MTNSFDQRRLADGIITRLSMEGASIQIAVRNWRELDEILTFKDCIGIEGYGVFNDALSHGTETINDPLIEKSCVICDENTDDFRCFSFFSAWSETPILKIIAGSFE